MGLVRTSSRQVRAVAVVAAALTGFGGAAAVDAMAQPDVAVADGFGAGDGLTRYVVSATSGDASPELLATLAGQDGVDSAQRLFDGSALVAADGVTPQQLRAVAGVSGVELSPSVPVLGTASDPYYAPYGWHLENTGANAYGQTEVRADADIDGSVAWDATTGDGMVVAVVDTGYDSDHPDLAGALWTNPSCGPEDADGDRLTGDCHGWNFTTNSPDVDNGTGGSHGATVAGVIGARKDNGLGSAGVAPDITLMPLVIGSGEGVDVNLGAQAIRYAADHGASVVNASWGGPVTGTALTALQSAVDYAASKGVLVVAAAGNDSGNRDTSLVYPASLTQPNVVTVGNSTAADTVAPSSAYGATSVDLFAPGTLVITTWNDGDYRLVSGTSIAAPQVAAALALYQATMPTASLADVRAAMLADVDPVAAFTGRSVTGGRLNVSRLDPAGAVRVGYEFTSMTGPVGPVSPQVRATGPAVAGRYEVVVGLGMEHGGEVFALSGEPLTFAGTTLTTDDAGQVTFPLGDQTTADGLTVAPTADLAQGRYALSVQLLVDGQPLGETFAAPLLVGDVTPAPDGTGGSTPAAPGTGDSDTGTGTDTGTDGSGTGGSGDPGTGGSGTGDTGTGTGGSGGGSTEPGTGDSGSAPDAPVTTPGTSTPGTGDSGTGDSGTGDGGTADPGSGDGTGSTPGTTPDSGTDSGTDTGTTPGTTPGDSPSTPGTTPGTDSPDTGTGDGSTPDVVTYPETGVFGLTSISPSVVSTAGGTRVTVTGTNLPDDVGVRIGGAQAATVLRADGTSVEFEAPARVAGSYDVWVFSAGGAESSVLTDALSYVDDPAGGGSSPGTDDGSGSDGSDGTGGGTTPADGTGGGAGDPVTTVGPNGERLVRSAAFRSLGASFWSLDCSTSCRGVRL
ncbi:S8 family serine peptidase [uncultured Modestobacter sp.]|uniref:S8 family serine peptidase n=1 Tax=uncultured Modestobacter sp. TaxID=380048 RepID=UPI00260554F0|nr:S8 family serine peptidase [uncultured Modestobacter sp.]